VLRPEIKVWRLDERQVKVTNGIHAFTIKPLEFVSLQKQKSVAIQLTNGLTKSWILVQRIQ